MFDGVAQRSGRRTEQWNKAKYAVVGAGALAAADGECCGVSAAGRHFGGGRERVAADNLRVRESVVQEGRAASAVALKMWLKSKPLIRLGNVALRSDLPLAVWGLFLQQPEVAGSKKLGRCLVRCVAAPLGEAFGLRCCALLRCSKVVRTITGFVQMV